MLSDTQKKLIHDIIFDEQNDDKILHGMYNYKRVKIRRKLVLMTTD